MISTARVEGRFVGSHTPVAGTFTCSSDDINQLQRNIVWGQRGNFLSVPTDCPQRDERLGWTADAQVFARTAMGNMELGTFYRKWMRDVVDAQLPNGAFSDVAPRAVDLWGSAPGWADCGIILPWLYWQAYADTRIIDESWDAMVRWLAWLQATNPDGIWRNERGKDFGDWLSIDADTPKDLIGTAYFAHDAALMAEMAEATGRVDEGAAYRALFRHVADAFNAEYVDDDGRIAGDTQTGYLLALAFDVLEGGRRAGAIRHLVDDIRRRGTRLSTGFMGVALLAPTLSSVGHADVAYDLLFQQAFPSWLYPIRHGATTIWERWDGWTEEKGFQDPGMNSFNHYSLGSVGEWLYERVGGIAPASPGFATIRIAPLVDDRLTWAERRYHSARGSVTCRWQRAGAELAIGVELPANTSGTVRVPGGADGQVLEGGQPLKGVAGIGAVTTDGPDRIVEIGSGRYRFTVTPSA